MKWPPARSEPLLRRKRVLDSSNVKFLSSSARGVLITLRKKIGEIKGQLLLCGLRPELRKVFQNQPPGKTLRVPRERGEALNVFDVSTVG